MTTISKQGNAVLWWLIASMALVALTATSLTVWMLYRTSYTETLKVMQHSAETLAGLMEAVARFDAKFSAQDDPQGSWGATMSQIEEGLRESPSAYVSEEMLVAYRDSQGVHVLRRKSTGRGLEAADLLSEEEAQILPLYQALQGLSGSGEMPDYKGVTVLAGYAPVPTLNIGIVHKIDLAELRSPYLYTAFWVACITLIMISLGALSFILFVRPLQRRVDDAESRERQAIEQSLERMNEAQRLAKVGNWELDLVTNKLTWSDEIFHMFEIDPAHFGASFEAFLNAIHPDDREEVNKAYTGSLKNRKPYEIVHRLKMADGRIKWVEERCVTDFADDGTPLVSRGTVHDITERALMELETRAFRDRLQLIIDASPDWIFAKDLEHRFLIVNRTFAEAQGLTPDEMINRPDTEFWSQELCEGDPDKGIRGFHADDRDAFAGKLTHNPHDPATFRDGSVHVFDTIKGPLRDLHGRVIGVFSYSRDITQRMEAEERYQSVVNTMTEGVVIQQADGQIVAANQAAERILGLSMDQMRGRTAMDPRWRSVREDGSPFPGEEHPGTVALRTGQVFHDAIMGVDHPGAGRRWLSINAVPLRLPGSGELYGSVATFTDITERKHAEEQLRLHRDQLEEVVRERTLQLHEAQRIARLGNWHWDLTTNAVNWSDETYRIFGYEPGSARSSYELFEARIHHDDRAMMRQFTQDVLAGVRNEGIDYRLLLDDGSLRWVRGDAAISLNSEGKPLAMTGTVHDITARKQTEQELIAAKDSAERANRAKSEFLSRMSHELRTPMNAILGFAQVLEIDVISTEQKEFTREILRAGSHLLELINELLDLSLIETGKLIIALQTVSVRDTVNEAMTLANSAAQANGVTALNHCSKDAAVLADPTRLKQVLINFLTNASKYNRSGGRIDVECSQRDNGRIRVAVRDTGHGLDPEKLAMLFRPFERVGAEYRTIDGAGIGLALSKRLTEMMNGTIGVESMPGKGSTFWIELPAAQPGSMEKQQKGDTPSVQAELHHTVLYVEDNAANLRVVEAIFRRTRKASLLSATNGAFGLELARRYCPDVILLDIHLPDMDGYAVLEALQKDLATHNIPVIAVSADAMPLDIERALRAGFQHYITKPIMVDQLLEVIYQYFPTESATNPQDRN